VVWDFESLRISGTGNRSINWAAHVMSRRSRAGQSTAQKQLGAMLQDFASDTG
jgi:hypothetical protein